MPTPCSVTSSKLHSHTVTADTHRGQAQDHLDHMNDLPGHHLTEDDDKPKHFCGVFGIMNHPRSAELTRLGLYALQHRGQESAGIMLLKDDGCHMQRHMGLVADAFRTFPNDWFEGQQQGAIGHVRYSTAGSSALVNAQPFAVEFDNWYLGLSHNGNLSNGGQIRQHLKDTGAILQGNTDTELLLHLAARRHQTGEPPWDALTMALKNVEGAFSIIALCEDGMAAFRDPYGWRPLCMGKLDDAVVFASETTAFDMVGATYERDVEPGEFILVGHDGSIQSTYFDFARRRAHCIFELVYFARPDSYVFNEQVYDIRRTFGAKLAEESPADADVVMPLPDGGVYAALGYAEAAGIPFDMGIVRNHYVGRTFIRPTEEDRRKAVKLKLNPVVKAIEGKKVCLVDDSIVRGNTSRERVRMLRECGAKEVHMRISCPPIMNPCFYGIDFASKDELIAHNHTIEEIAEIIQVDSLAYLSLDGMLSCVGNTKPGDYCHACYSGKYPVKPKSGIARDNTNETPL